jgi:hypothetical protein
MSLYCKFGNHTGVGMFSSSQPFILKFGFAETPAFRHVEEAKPLLSQGNRI